MDSRNTKGMHIKKLHQKVLFEGQWLTLIQETFQMKDNAVITWESVKKKGSELCAVVLAKCSPSNRFIIIRQFRPSINNYILSLPAGILNTNNIQEESLRELKEETGYIGKVISVSPSLRLNAAIMTSSAYLVRVEVDEWLSENQNPFQELEPEEDIDVLLIPKTEMSAFLQDQAQKGIEISAVLWYLFAVNTDF